MEVGGEGWLLDTDLDVSKKKHSMSDRAEWQGEEGTSNVPCSQFSKAGPVVQSNLRGVRDCLKVGLPEGDNKKSRKTNSFAFHVNFLL